MAYCMIVGGLYHYMDEDSRYEAGVFATTDGSPAVEWSSRQYVLAHGAELIASVHGAASPV